MKRINLLLFGLLISASMLMSVFAQPNPPVNLSAAINAANIPSVKLTWDAVNPSPTPNTMVKYNVYRKIGAINDTGIFVRRFSNLMHNYVFDNHVIPGKTYSYYVTAINQQGESGPSNMVEITIVPPPPPASGIITGLLTNETSGQPIFKGKIKLFKYAPGFSKVVVSDSLGNFGAVLPTGTYYLYASAIGYFSEYYENAAIFANATPIVLGENDSLHLNIGLLPFTPPVLYDLSGTVTNDLGQPEKARINVFRLRNNTHHFANSFAVTDSNGNYTVKVKEGDTVIVFAKPFKFEFLPEYFDNKRTFNEADRIYVGGNVTNINFVLDRKPVFANGIEGVVADSLGNSVESMVMAIRKFNAPTAAPRKYVTPTDSLTGAYTFSNLLPGMYILFAKPFSNYYPTYFRYDGAQTLNWRMADSVIVTETGVISNINFTVKPLPDTGFGRITGIIKDGARNAVNGAFVYATDNTGTVYSYAISDINGNFILDGLNQGSYKLVCDLMGFNPSEKNVEVDYQNSALQSVQFTLVPEGVTSVSDNKLSPANFSLDQNYPNPFNPSTMISYSIPIDGFVSLKVYNIIGKEVAFLVNGFQKSGKYDITFDASKLTSGVYFYTIKAGEFASTKKMILMR